MAPPDFDWDPIKAASNEAKHGVTFRYATAVFLDLWRKELSATHERDGEPRWKMVGMINGRLFTLVYTLRGKTVRVISARRANTQEKHRYDDR